MEDGSREEQEQKSLLHYKQPIPSTIGLQAYSCHGHIPVIGLFLSWAYSCHGPIPVVGLQREDLEQKCLLHCKQSTQLIHTFASRASAVP